MTRNREALALQARRFAGTMQDLLGRTVCDYAQVTAKVDPRDQAIVGTRLNGLTSNPIEMRTAGSEKIWIDVNCRLTLDEHEARFLTVEASFCGLYFGDGGADLLLYYDFQRDKKRYTEAHLQICARNDEFEQFMKGIGRKGANALHKIHLPVGGRRFRPALEDLLECLIVEDLVRPKPGWRDILDETRRIYRRRQISAVVRRNLGTAIQELERLGYTVSEPKDENSAALIRRLVIPRPRDGEHGTQDRTE